MVNLLLDTEQVAVVAHPGEVTTADELLTPSDAAWQVVEHTIDRASADCGSAGIDCLFTLTAVEPIGDRAIWRSARNLEFELAPETNGSGKVTALIIETTTAAVTEVKGFHAPSGVPQQFQVRFVHAWSGEVVVRDGELSYEAEWKWREEIYDGSDWVTVNR